MVDSIKIMQATAKASFIDNDQLKVCATIPIPFLSQLNFPIYRFVSSPFILYLVTSSPFQCYGLVDSSFYRRYGSEPTQLWHLMDFNKNENFIFFEVNRHDQQLIVG